MALILTSRTPWRRRPSGLVEIDRSSPLANGLVAAVAPPYPVDLVSRSQAALTGTLSATPEYWDATGAGERSWTATAAQRLTEAISVAIWIYDTGGTVTGSPIGHVLSDWSWTFEENASEQWDFRINSGGHARYPATSVGGGLDFMHGQWNLLVGTYDRSLASGNLRILVNGVWRTTSADYTLAIADYADPISIGSRGGPVTRFTGRIGDAYIWNRALALSEIWALYDPATRWSLYQPLVRRVYFDLGGGGGTTYNESPSFAAVSSLPISAAATSAAVIGLAATAGMSPVGAATAAASMSLAATSAVGQSGAAASAASVDFTSAAAQTHAVTCLSSVSVAMSALAALTMSDGSTQNVSESLSFTATATQQMAAAAVAEAVQTYLVATGLTQVPAVTAGAALAVSASAALSHSVTGQASALVILTAATNLLMAAQANGDISYAVLHAASETLRAALATSNTITDASVASEEWHN